MFRRFISCIILISYLHNLVNSSIVWASDVQVLNPYHFKIHSSKSNYGFEIETNSDSSSDFDDSGDESTNKQKKQFSKKAVFEPSLIADKYKRAELEKALNLLNKIKWGKDGVSWPSGDGLILTFDWMGNLKIDGDLAYDQPLKSDPFSFSNPNRITIGDNLNLESLILQSPNF
jgi:hypothetical protein